MACSDEGSLVKTNPDRDDVSLAQIHEDESWSDFYAALEVEAEIEADCAYEERFIDYDEE